VAECFAMLFCPSGCIRKGVISTVRCLFKGKITSNASASLRCLSLLCLLSSGTPSRNCRATCATSVAFSVRCITHTAAHPSQHASTCGESKGLVWSHGGLCISLVWRSPSMQPRLVPLTRQ